MLALSVALGCGGRATSTAEVAGAAPTSVGPVAPSPSPSAAASPSAAPEADRPNPEPSPDCIHETDHGVDSVSLVVYFVECGGKRIPGSRETTQVPVGCRIHFNATPRDGMGAPTCSRTWPVWQVGPEELVTGGGGDTFTATYTAQAEGRLSARCIVDGVRSDWVFLSLVEP